MRQAVGPGTGMAPPVAPGRNELIEAQLGHEARAGEELDAVDQALLGELETSVDGPTIARALVRLMARAFARDVRGGRSPRHDHAKKALEELRLTEAGWLELERERGTVIERTVARACMGQLANRYKLSLERVETRLAGQVEAWLGDPKFLALPTEDRGRAVRQWITSETRSAREVEAIEIERMIAAEIKEQSGGEG